MLPVVPPEPLVRPGQRECPGWGMPRYYPAHTATLRSRSGTPSGWQGRLAVEPPRMPEHVDPVSLLHNAPPYPSNAGPVGAVDTLEVPAEPLPPPDPPSPEDPDGEPPPPDDEPPPPELTGEEEPPPPPPPELPRDPGAVAVTVMTPPTPVVPMFTGGGAGSATACVASRPPANSIPASATTTRPPYGV